MKKIEEEVEVVAVVVDDRKVACGIYVERDIK
jgi:hypothetical protein